MKRLLTYSFFLILFSISSALLAQEKNQKTFTIKSENTSIDLKPYINAIEKGDFTCYRFLNTERELHFETGVIVTLCSALSYKILNPTSASDCYLQESNKDVINKTIFKLHPSGFITQEITNAPTKQQQK